MIDIAFSLIIPIILFFFGGMWLDKQLNLKFPFFTFFGFFLGMLVGFWSVYKRSIKP